MLGACQQMGPDTAVALAQQTHASLCSTIKPASTLLMCTLSGAAVVAVDSTLRQHIAAQQQAVTLRCLMAATIGSAQLSTALCCPVRSMCCWQGSLGERITSFFIGGAPCLRVEEVVYSPGDRFRLQTVSGGVVHLQLGERLCCLDRSALTQL
jgi:hypothetical protein